LPGYLAGTLSITGHQSRHAAARVTGREILIALIVIAAIVVLLVAPVLWGALFDGFTKGLDKAARPTFLVGLGVLVVGLLSGVQIIEIGGGALMAAIVLGVIVENYLTAPMLGPAAAVMERCRGAQPIVLAAWSPRR
jgi:lysylphosphatidylglycerol synthetase-like protein (DUF2156 family)